jgi:hypothetical protein
LISRFAASHVFASLKRLALRGILAPLAKQQRRSRSAMNADATPRRSAGGRPKGDPAARRSATIGVRVSASEYAELREKAAQMRMTPAPSGCAKQRSRGACRRHRSPRSTESNTSNWRAWRRT